MLSGYHYFPFPLAGLADETMKTSRARWIAAVGASKCLVSSLAIQTINPQIVNEFQSGKSAALAGVPSGAVLNIDGHGSKTRPILGAKFNSHLSETPSYHQRYNSSIPLLYFTADVLAARLKKDGLPTGHKRIDMLICHAGEAGSGGDAHRTFASLFAQHLGKIGYSKIIVGGFPGEAATEGEGKTAKNTVKLSVLGAVDARYKIRYFNASGDEVLLG